MKRKFAVVAMLAVVMLTVSTPAMAAPRDDPGDGIIRRIIRIVRLVVHATDDGGMLIPPIPH